MVIQTLGQLGKDPKYRSTIDTHNMPTNLDATSAVGFTSRKRQFDLPPTDCRPRFHICNPSSTGQNFDVIFILKMIG